MKRANKETARKVYYTWEQFDEDIDKIVKIIKRDYPNIKCIYGIPKGGLVPAIKIANRLNLPLYLVLAWADEQCRPESILIVDDCVDVGTTLGSIKDIDKYITATIFIKPQSKIKPKIWCRECSNDKWVVFGWE